MPRGAYVAIGPFAVACAIVRDGVLVLAREMPWGYEGELGTRYPAPQTVDELARRLASELRRSFLFFKQGSREDVSQVLLCGALPDLRSLTAPLIRLLDVEVETLDSLEGIDAGALPEPADRFREHVAELRLAWALSADPAPPVNLLPAPLVPARSARRRRLLLAAGVAAAVAASAAMWSGADSQARAAERQAQQLAQRVSELEPRVTRIQAARADAALESVRQSALAAFDTQGPRLARVLETLARLAPGDVTLRSVTASAEGAFWRLSIAGTSAPADPIHAQATVTGFLDRLQASPYFGPPTGPPALRMIPERADTAPAGAGGEGAGRGQPPPMPGRVGVEFTVEFMVRK